MSETITSITRDESDPSWHGYIIVTTKQTIKVHISTDQQCCEGWSIAMEYPLLLSEAKAIGAQVTGKPSWGKDRVNSTSYDDKDDITVTVNIPTFYGTIAVCAHNRHNGYYPHEVRVSWDGHEDTQKV